jgi:hypothetical protein
MEVGGREIAISGRLIRVARFPAEIYEPPLDPVRMCDTLRASDLRIDLFTFMQKLPDTTRQYRYQMEWDNLAALRISTFDHWLRKQINTQARKALRIAQIRGIVAREVAFDDTLVRGISAIYNESPVRQGRRFWHYGKNLDTVRRENGTFAERSVFIGAFYDSELVGFAKVVCDLDGEHAGFMQIVTLIRHWDKRPSRVLIAQAVRSCADRGIGCLLFSQFAYGEKQSDGLSHFKQLNGFRRIDLPRYYVPLTMTGRIALRLGLHRPIRQRVPEPILAHLRRARRRWYERAPQIANG